MHINDLIIHDKEVVSLDDVILNTQNQKMIEQLMREHKFIAELTQYGLPVNNKVLLQGSSGCGKTTTAKAIAQRMDKPILILNLSNIVSARIGETSQHLKQIFDKAARDKAVLFLDEFDQIGKARSSTDKDVGEMRRLVNTLIQLMDYFPKNGLLICASNHPEVIDSALLRRFQLKINFEMPSKKVLNEYYDTLLAPFPENMRDITRKYNISFAEAKDYAYTLVKSTLMDELEKGDSEL